MQERTIFTTWGDYWEKDQVDFGSPGTLYGTAKPGVGPKIDFKEQAGVYILFSPSRDPIYVGQSGRGHRKIWHRLKDHANSRHRSRWSNFTWFGFYEPNEEGYLQSQIQHPEYSEHTSSEGQRINTNVGHALNEVEGVLIHVLEPLLNRQGARFGNLTEYYQLGKDPQPEEGRASLDKIWDELKGIKSHLGISTRE